MGTSREGKVTPSEHHFVQLKETRESSYQVYFILLCWHKKEVIELFYPVLMTTTRTKNVLFLGGKDRPLVAAPKSRFPVTYVMYRKKKTIISYFIPLLLYFRNNYCMSVCHVFFSLSCAAHRLHVYTRGSVSVNQQSWNHCELVNHPESRRRRWGCLLMSSWSDWAY